MRNDPVLSLLSNAAPLRDPRAPEPLVPERARRRMAPAPQTAIQLLRRADRLAELQRRLIELLDDWQSVGSAPGISIVRYVVLQGAPLPELELEEPAVVSASWSSPGHRVRVCWREQQPAVDVLVYSGVRVTPFEREVTLQQVDLDWLSGQVLVLKASVEPAEPAPSLPAWLTDLYDQHLDQPLPDRSALREVMRELQKLLRAGQHEEVNALLEHAELDRLHTSFGVALVRTPFTCRHQLGAWRAAVRRLHAVLEGRGQPAGELLIGLLDGALP